MGDGEVVDRGAAGGHSGDDASRPPRQGLPAARSQSPSARVSPPTDPGWLIDINNLL